MGETSASFRQSILIIKKMDRENDPILKLNDHDEEKESGFELS